MLFVTAIMNVSVADKKNKTSIKIIALILVLLFLTFLAVYLINKNKVLENKSWKTYKNETFGLQIKYPRDYLVTDSDQSKIRIIPSEWKNSTLNHPYLSVNVVKTKKTIDGWVNEKINQKLSSGYASFDENCSVHCVSRTPSETFVGSNLRALEYFTWGVSGGDKYTITKKPSSNLLLEITNHTAGSRESGKTKIPQTISDQILSSLEFDN